VRPGLPKPRPLGQEYLQEHVQEYVIRWLPMASQNSPVLFQALPQEGGMPTSPSLGEGRETWLLVHALTATLNHPDPLPVLAEVLGTHLGARACLLLCHYGNPNSGTHSGTRSGPNDLVYISWHQGTASTSHRLPLAEAGAALDWPLDWQRRVALTLIQQTFDQSMGNAWPHWQKGLAELLQQDHQPPDWLRSIAAATAIAVDGAGFQGSILLLGAAGIGVDPTLRANLASLGAIAFQQHQLQGQAQRNAKQLRHLNALKEDFLSTLNHELRTPLTSMMLAIRMLRRPDLTPDRAALYLDILEQQCSREIGLVNDLLMLQTLESKVAPAVRQTTDLGQLLGDVAEQSTVTFQQAQLSLDWQPPAQVVVLSTDPDLWTKVLRELLGNARKYSAPQTAVTLALADHRAQNGRVTLQISNLGAAIEADELPHIFDKFRRGRHATSDGIAGTGTGLALVRGLVAQLGGTIRVSSHPSDADPSDPSPSDATLWQTCFTLELEP